MSIVSKPKFWYWTQTLVATAWIYCGVFLAVDLLLRLFSWILPEGFFLAVAALLSVSLMALLSRSAFSTMNSFESMWRKKNMFVIEFLIMCHGLNDTEAPAPLSCPSWWPCPCCPEGRSGLGNTALQGFSRLSGCSPLLPPTKQSITDMNDANRRE